MSGVGEIETNVAAVGLLPPSFLLFRVNCPTDELLDRARAEHPYAATP